MSYYYKKVFAFTLLFQKKIDNKVVVISIRSRYNTNCYMKFIKILSISNKWIEKYFVNSFYEELFIFALN